MGVSPRNESDLFPGVRPIALPDRPLLVVSAELARLRSSALNRSLEVIYFKRLCAWLVFLPQLSTDRCFLTSTGEEPGVLKPRSMEIFPRLCTSASLDADEPLEDGLEAFLPLRKLRKPPPVGDLGAVNEEKPLGGLAVFTTGGAAASSSRSGF